MASNDPVILTRDVDASLVPAGTSVVLKAGEKAFITQTLGGNYTVVVNGNMFRIEEKDGDALGFKSLRPKKYPAKRAPLARGGKGNLGPVQPCYDPEIPVNIVDLGLVYTCESRRSSQGQPTASR